MFNDSFNSVKRGFQTSVTLSSKSDLAVLNASSAILAASLKFFIKSLSGTPSFVPPSSIIISFNAPLASSAASSRACTSVAASPMASAISLYSSTSA